MSVSVSSTNDSHAFGILNCVATTENAFNSRHILIRLQYFVNNVFENSEFFCKILYEGHMKSSWTGGSESLLCIGRRWLLCQVVVVGVTW